MTDCSSIPLFEDAVPPGPHLTHFAVSLQFICLLSLCLPEVRGGSHCCIPRAQDIIRALSKYLLNESNKSMPTGKVTLSSTDSFPPVGGQKSPGSVKKPTRMQEPVWVDSRKGRLEAGF